MSMKFFTMKEYNGTSYDTLYPDCGYTTTATLSASGWSSLTQTVSVSAVSSDCNVYCFADPSSYAAWNKYGVRCTAQGSGTLTFTCNAMPTSAITVNIMVSGGGN